MESCYKPVFLIPTPYMLLCSKAPLHSYSQEMMEGNLTSTQSIDPLQLILIFSPKSERSLESLTLLGKATFFLYRPQHFTYASSMALTNWSHYSNYWHVFPLGLSANSSLSLIMLCFYCKHLAWCLVTKSVPHEENMKNYF